jgi:hypothetical protein
MPDCTYSVPDKDVSGDNLYGPRISHQEFVDWVWDAYNFDYDFWQDGWGWDDCFNTDKPLARAFCGLWALNFSSVDPWNEDYDDNMLNWGGRYVREQMSGYDLRAGCGTSIASTFGAGCTEYREGVRWDCTQYQQDGYESCSWDCCEWWPCSWGCKALSWLCKGWIWLSSWTCIAWGNISSWFCTAGNEIVTDKRIELHTRFFYDSQKDVAARASTFIHECRHIAGKAHDTNFPSGSAFGAGDSGADSSWDYDGAWKWQVCWLSWYFATAQSSTDALREKARDDANTILLGAFATNPGFLV